VVAVNTSLLILGLNIVVVSALLSLYGLIIGDSGLVGIAASLGLAGGVIVAYSRAPQDPSTTSLLNYSKALVNTVTSVLEDLDLLESNICIARKDTELLMVYSKTPCPVEVDPGLGFSSGSPYLAIPIETPSIEITETSSTSITEESIERVLRSLLVDDLTICRGVKVASEGESYRVFITGLAEYLKDFTKYPIDPYTMLVLTIVSYTTSARCVRLVQRIHMPEGLMLILRVEK